ncbi:hypothetical protein HMPREF9056_02165 [Actinomyces sp. oral taxon 170 str. F0386]|nr:hypothetical protein HMPREF9056_02165 [Actinomyces sp. oral taxon 170 str. F0386]
MANSHSYKVTDIHARGQVLLAQPLKIKNSALETSSTLHEHPSQHTNHTWRSPS